MMLSAAESIQEEHSASDEGEPALDEEQMAAFSEKQLDLGPDDINLT